MKTILRTVVILSMTSSLCSFPASQPASADTFDCSHVTSIPETECEALVAFYEQTSEHGWYKNDLWLADNLPENWYGITVQNGHVTAIDLPENNLSGTLPDEISNLTFLSKLDLATNLFYLEIPSGLASLTNLMDLDLSENRFFGEIPAFIPDLSSLTNLNLSQNQLTGEIPSSLESLTNLTELDLSDNLLSGTIPESLGNLSNLISLELEANLLEGSIPESLGNLTNLQVLNLGDNLLSGTIPGGFSWNNLPDLIELDLGENNLSGNIPVNLNEAAALKVIDLSSNSLTGTIPASFGSFAYIKTVNLDNNHLTGDIPDELDQMNGGVVNSYISPVLNLKFNLLTVPSGYPETGNTLHEWLEKAAMGWSTNQSSGFDCNTDTDLPYIECNALQRLYENTYGYDWTDNTNWLTNQPADEWFGVDVTDGHVTGITLVKNNLQGRMPAEVADLEYLETLDLSNNGIYAIPNTPRRLKNLQYLNLRMNTLDFSQSTSRVGLISTLQYLDLSGTSIYDQLFPIRLCNLTNLHTLKLYNSYFEGELPSEIGNLVNLQTLEFSGNFITSLPEAFVNLSNLVTLDFSMTRLSVDAADVLAQLPNLQYLDLSKSEITGEIPEILGDLHNLTYLNLANNSLEGEIPTSYSNLTNLQELYLNSNQLSGSIPEFVSTLKDLSVLNLEDNNFTEKIPTGLASLSNLTIINLANNQLIGTIPSEFSELNDLTRLILDHNKFTGTIPTSLGTLSNLEYLLLNNNRLSGELPDSLQNLTKLADGDQFSLDFNRLVIPSGYPVDGNLFHTWLSTVESDWHLNQYPAFDCSTISEIPVQECESLQLFYESDSTRNWTNASNWLRATNPSTWYGVTISDGHVTELNLSNNNLQISTIPDELFNLTNLTRLDLSNNNISGSIPSSIGVLTNLTTLILENNQLSGKIPVEFYQLTNLKTLDLSGNALSTTSFNLDGFSSLTKLTILDLSDNKIYGTSIEVLTSLPLLEELNLNKNNLWAEIPTNISKLTNLNSLDIGNNDFNGSIPSSIGNLSNLIDLNLSNNYLSGYIPPHLSKITRLETLDLSSNMLSGKIPSQLGNLTHLTSLNLSSNRLESYIPESFINLTNLGDGSGLSLARNSLAIPSDYPNPDNEFHIFLQQKAAGWDTTQGVKTHGSENDLGFRPGWDGFSFTNQSGNPVLQDLIDLYGTDSICVTTQPSCQPRKSAEILLADMQESLNGGFGTGMAVASLQFFTETVSPDRFETDVLIPYQFTNPPVDALSDYLTTLSLGQFSNSIIEARSSGTSQTSKEILDNLLSSNTISEYLSIQEIQPDGSILSRSLIPYGFRKEEDNTIYDFPFYYLYVYDSNYPGDYYRTIFFPYCGDFYWSYDTGTQGVWEGDMYTQTMQLVPISEYKTTDLPTPWSLTGDISVQSNSSRNVWMQGEGSLVAKDTNGKLTGIFSGIQYRDIPGSSLSFVDGGLDYTSDQLFELPNENTYQFTWSASDDASTSITQFSSGNALKLDLDASATSKADLTMSDDSHNVTLKAGGPLDAALQFTSESSNSSRLAALTGLDFASGDQISASYDPDNGQVVINGKKSSGGSYEFTISLFINGKTSNFNISNLTLQSGDTHYLNFRLGSTSQAIVTLEIDRDSDGMIDETLPLTPEESFDIYLPGVIR